MADDDGPAPAVPMRIEITTAKPSDARKPPFVRLRVTDDVSGVVIVDVEVEAWRWWDIITGGGRVLPGFVGPDLDRVGKVMLNDSVDVPGGLVEDAIAHIPYGREHLTERETAGARAAEAYAATLPDAERWATLAGHHTNAGWKVTRRRWVDPTDPDAADRLTQRAKYQVGDS